MLHPKATCSTQTSKKEQTQQYKTQAQTSAYYDEIMWNFKKDLF